MSNSKKLGYLMCLIEQRNYHTAQEKHYENGGMMSMAESIHGASFHKEERQRYTELIHKAKADLAGVDLTELEALEQRSE